MAGEIKTRIVLDGEQQFRQAMNNATSAVKTLTAEEKSAEAQFKATGDAQTYKAEKTRILNEKLEEQKKAVEAAEKAVKELTEKGVAKNDKAMQQWRTRLANANTALANTQTALANLDGRLRNTAQEMDNTAQASADMAATLSEIGRQFSVQGAVKALNDIQHSVDSAWGHVMKLGKSIWSLASEAGDWAFNVRKQATEAGVDVETYQSWDYAATQIGTSVDAILASEDTLYKGLTSKHESTMTALNDIGVAMSENGVLRDSGDVFWDAVDALHAIGDEAKQAEKAQAVFGASWRQMMPLIKQGSEGWRGYVTEAESVAVVSEENVDNLNEFYESKKRLDAALNKTEMTVLGALAPVFSQVADAMAQSVTAFNDFLATPEGKELLQNLAEALAGIIECLIDEGPEGFKKAVSTAATVLQALVDGLTWLKDNWEGVVTAIEAIGGALLLLKIGSGVLKFIELLLAAKGASAKEKKNWFDFVKQLFRGGGGDDGGGDDGGGGTGVPLKRKSTGSESDDGAPGGGTPGDGTPGGDGGGEESPLLTVAQSIDTNVQAILELLRPSGEGPGEPEAPTGPDDGDEPPAGPTQVTFPEGDPALTALQSMDTNVGSILELLTPGETPVEEPPTAEEPGPTTVTFSPEDPALVALQAIDQATAAIRVKLEGDAAWLVTLGQDDPALTALQSMDTTLASILELLTPGEDPEPTPPQDDGDDPGVKPVDLTQVETDLAALKTFAEGEAALACTDIGKTRENTDRILLTAVNIAEDLERVAWYLENADAIKAAARARQAGNEVWAAILSGATAVSGYTGDWTQVGAMKASAGMGLRAAGAGVGMAQASGYTFTPDQYKKELEFLRGYDLREYLTEETARLLYEGKDASGKTVDAEQIVPQVLMELSAVAQALESGETDDTTFRTEIQALLTPLPPAVTGIQTTLQQILGLLQGLELQPANRPVPFAYDPDADPLDRHFGDNLIDLTEDGTDAVNGVEEAVEAVEDATEDAADKGAAAADSAGNQAAKGAENAGRGVENAFRNMDFTVVWNSTIGDYGSASWGSGGPDVMDWSNSPATRQGSGGGGWDFHYIRNNAWGGRLGFEQVIRAGEDGVEYVIPITKGDRAYDLTMRMLGESDQLRERVAEALGAASRMSAAAGRPSVRSGGAAGSESAAILREVLAAGGAGAKEPINATIVMDKTVVGYMVADAVNERIGAKVSASRRG